MNKLLYLLLLVLIGGFSLAVFTLDLFESNNASIFKAFFWLLFLIFLNWLVSFSYFSNTKNKYKNEKFGVLPSISILITIYSIVSGIFIILNTFINLALLNDYHLSIQIVLITIVISLCLVMLITSAGAVVGNNEFLPKLDLIKLINKKFKFYQLNKNNDDDITSKINDLIAYIKYKMPHLSSIDLDAYNDVINEIHSIESEKMNSNDRVVEIFNSINRDLRSL